VATPVDGTALIVQTGYCLHLAGALHHPNYHEKKWIAKLWAVRQLLSRVPHLYVENLGRVGRVLACGLHGTAAKLSPKAQGQCSLRAIARKWTKKYASPFLLTRPPFSCRGHSPTTGNDLLASGLREKKPVSPAFVRGDQNLSPSPSFLPLWREILASLSYQFQK